MRIKGQIVGFHMPSPAQPLGRGHEDACWLPEAGLGQEAGTRSGEALTASQDFTATQQTVTSRDDAQVLSQEKPRGVKWKRLSVGYDCLSTLFLYKWSAPRLKASHGVKVASGPKAAAR